LIKKKKRVFRPNQIFLPTRLRTLRARASAILLAGVEATSPRTHN